MHRLSLILAAAALVGCEPTGDEVAIQIMPLVNGQEFSCASDLQGMGTTSATMTPTDFRMFVHDVTVITADGTREPLALTDDDQWQGDGSVLLDFSDGQGACEDANGMTNDLIVGTVPTGTEVTGVEFLVGMPPEKNHIDAATAEAPYDETGMWWTWSGGFKWIRIEMQDAAGAPFYFHHGATGCDGTPTDGFACAYDNATHIVVDSFDPTSQMLSMDIGTLFAGNDFDAPVDFGAGDFVKGCMAFGGDPECQPIFEKLGINFEDDAPGPAQTVFSAM
jgi:uncharacterized repeat protein (TIGR04052 family)